VRHKPGLLQMDLVQPAVIDVGAVDDQDAVRFQTEFSGHLNFMGFPIGDDDTSGDVALAIKKDVDIQDALGLAKPGPPKDIDQPWWHPSL